MSFHFDFDKKELVAAESENEKHSLFDSPVVILGACGGVMYIFINYIAPFLGHLFFGAFL